MQVEKSSENYNINKCCKPQVTMKYGKMSKESDEIKPELEKKLHSIAKEEGFTKYTIHAKNITPSGNNYMGSLSEITIEDTDKKDSNKRLELFVKCVISLVDNVVVNINDLYNREIFVYTELAKIFNELQDAANVPTQERFRFVKSYKESNNEFVIMENMVKKDFSTRSRFEIMSIDFAEKSIEQLARFHALSFVLQQKRPQYYKKIIDTYKFPLDFGEQWKIYTEKLGISALDCLNETTKAKFEKIIPNLCEIYKSLYTPQPNSVSCVCHGDFKTNNLLCRENNGEIEVIPVDYQFIHHGSPLTDLMLFIFTGTDKEFRRKHLNHLKNFYYNTMEKYLKHFDVFIEECFPREEYERVYARDLMAGLAMCVWFFPVVLNEETNVVDLGEASFSELQFGSSERVKVRFQDIVDNFIEWGYL